MSVFGFCCEGKPAVEQFEVVTKPVLDTFAWTGTGGWGQEQQASEEVKDSEDIFDVATPLVDPYNFSSEVTSGSGASDELAYQPVSDSYASRKFARLGGDLL
eukprot:CAMPEP_0204320146 /NCGR_PEP_ID=MMETSP0469-20131031/7495_1 /ASSEMBLY_ACC=CAM_ASM_000384 /TAXON_ID=2969 /ORGANISM="Oxyrrhis marina" /LENGTH=101 /DNA_ID=CAMNT_0051301407 /DNA_START=32 /DNA_END=337 /DNA_ORIENTATION=+